MRGEVLQWSPDASPLIVDKWINNAYRRIIDKRMWYGLMVKGQVSVPSVYTTGTATVTNASTAVVGIGTAWDNTFVGRQFRQGFSSPFYTIKSVQSATALTLDLPWGNPSATSTGYQILQNIVSLGNNIKFVIEMVNQRQGYRLYLNMPQDVLNRYDTWRTTTGWTFLLANREPSSDGQPQFELYPSPTFQQVFPFLAYIQPPDMKNDTDFPYLFIRSDALVNDAISQALTFRGPRLNKYYDPAEAQRKEMKFREIVEDMSRVDNCLYQTDMKWDFGQWPFSTYGAQFMQSHSPDFS
jgi:hypothetical protein